ncbi:acetyl-CoA carboxylase carboxyl transferase subunit alpha, partial [Candidatus Omnitrophota bacterium]
VEEVVSEPLGGAHKDPDVVAQNLKTTLLKHLHELKACSDEELLNNRYEKFRKIGPYHEG